MKKQYKYLFIILILLQLLLTSCINNSEEYDGHDPMGIGFKSFNEVIENFGGVMAYPSYIPFEFNTVEDVKVVTYGTSTNKYKDLPKEEYKRIEIYDSITIRYYLEDGKDLPKDNNPYKLSWFNFSFSTGKNYKMDFSRISFMSGKEYEVLEHKGYIAYYEEQIHSKTLKPELKDENMLRNNYYMKFDKKIYKFSFSFEINQNIINKEDFLELRDKIKAEALEEVIKSYESFKYEKKD